jgi:ankyrin repeat protein
MEACESGDYAATRSLIEAGVDVNYKDTFGNTALFYSALRSHIDVMRLLLTAGADVGTTNLDGSPPLMAAVLSGKLEPVQILLHSGASPAISNNHGYTPLQAAEDRAFTDIAALLRTAGATV